MDIFDDEEATGGEDEGKLLDKMEDVIREVANVESKKKNSERWKLRKALLAEVDYGKNMESHIHKLPELVEYLVVFANSLNSRIGQYRDLNARLIASDRAKKATKTATKLSAAIQSSWGCLLDIYNSTLGQMHTIEKLAGAQCKRTAATNSELAVTYVMCQILKQQDTKRCKSMDNEWKKHNTKTNNFISRVQKKKKKDDPPEEDEAEEEEKEDST